MYPPNHKLSRYFVDHAAKADLGSQSVRAGAVSIFGRTVMKVSQVGSVLFLSRLLSPEDYGLVAMVTAIIGFAPVLVDLGTRDAIVQRERITGPEVSALFWISAIVGCTFAALTAASGPFIARFYGEPRLTMIAVVSALTFVAVVLINHHQALMQRALMFRELAMIEIVANVLSACAAVVMAFHGSGYWALVTRSLAMYCLMAIGVWSFCPWVPGRPGFTAGTKDMLKLGGLWTTTTLIDFGGGNLDRVLIGRGLGARTLGFYQQALFIYANLLDVFVFTLYPVAVASLSKLRNEPDEFRRCWAKALSTLAFFSMPVFGVLAVTSRDMVVLMLGERWSTAGVILSVLALRGIPHPVERTMGWLCVSMGRADLSLRWGAIATVTQVAALFCGLPFGTMGVAVAYTLSMFVLFIPAVAYAGHPLRIGAFDVIRVVGRQLVGSLIASAVGVSLGHYALSGWNRFLRVSLMGSVFLAVYFVIVFGLLNLRTPVHVLVSAARGILPARFTPLVTAVGGKGE